MLQVINDDKRPGPIQRSRPLVLAFSLCILIAVAAVLRRILALVGPVSSSAPPELARLDAAFAAHATLTLAHILPALLFVVLIPVVLFRKGGAHRVWPERLLFATGIVVGVTAYAMARYSVGGWLERSAVLVFDTLFLFSLLRAYVYATRGDQERKWRWLVRAVAVLLGIATTRPVMGIFFATSRITHLTPHEFFGIAFWIGFAINTFGIELYLRYGRHRSSVRTAPILSDGAA